jgi:hypothetical protein
MALGIGMMQINSFLGVALITDTGKWAFSTDFDQAGLTIEAVAKGVCPVFETVAKAFPLRKESSPLGINHSPRFGGCQQR